MREVALLEQLGFHESFDTASSPRLKLKLSASVMSNFRRDDEALLAAASTEFTWSSVGLVNDVN